MLFYKSGHRLPLVSRLNCHAGAARKGENQDQVKGVTWRPDPLFERLLITTYKTPVRQVTWDKSKLTCAASGHPHRQ